MAGNSFGTLFRVTTWGESHGRAVGAVVDGCPAGLDLSEEDVQRELDRRRPGYSTVSTARREEDRAEILSGLFEGKTTGTPISILVWNRDAQSGAYDLLRNRPRPGHADWPYLARYGIRDHRGGGRSSGRETVGRVAAGAVAKKLLAGEGIEVAGYVRELGGVRAIIPNLDDISNLREEAEKNPVRCPDQRAAAEMIETLEEVRKGSDTLGGVVEVVAWGVPAGLGEPVFDKLDGDLASALMGIGAVKAVEIGAGMEAARMRGSESNDPILPGTGGPYFATNNAGGILGGISTGSPIIIRIAVKPTPSISRTQRTVDLTTGDAVEIEIKGRHDPAIPPRIVPVAEAMVALVLADHLLRRRVARV
ncbi:MAG: chorismate synthase [Methanothrix sp.]